jgi:DNA polymerase delta subunit 1
MVQFGVDTVEAAMKLGKEAAEYISGTFIKVGVSNYFTRS